MSAPTLSTGTGSALSASDKCIPISVFPTREKARANGSISVLSFPVRERVTGSTVYLSRFRNESTANAGDVCESMLAVATFPAGEQTTSVSIVDAAFSFSQLLSVPVSNFLFSVPFSLLISH